MYKTLSTKKIFQHKRIVLLEDEIAYEDGTLDTYLRFEHVNNGAQVIAIRDDGKILIIEEYFHPIGKCLLNIPGGTMKVGDNPVECARRELKEETGYLTKNIIEIGKTHHYLRRDSGLTYFFVAKDIVFQGLELESSEQDLKVLWFSEDEIDLKIKNNEIENIYFLAHWLMYKSYKGLI